MDDGLMSQQVSSGYGDMDIWFSQNKRGMKKI